MLTPEQEKELETITAQIAKLRERQRILYGFQNGQYLTESEKTAQLARLEVIKASDEQADSK